MKKRLLSMVLVTALTIGVVGTTTGCSLKRSNSGGAATAESSDVSDEEAESDDVYTIRVACENSDTYPATRGLQVMKDYVEKNTDGKVIVNIYAGGQLGGEEETLEQVAQGSLEMTICSLAPIVSYNPQFAVMDIPFLFDSYPEAWMVLDSHVGTDMLDSLESCGMVGLSFMENGFRQITSSAGPVSQVSDLSGLKLRTMQNNNHIAFFQKLGANPTPVAFSELYMALSQHTVDAQENPIANVTDKKLYEVQGYLSLTNHIYDTMPLICNKDYFDSLPSKYQGIIRAGAILGMEYSRFCNSEREDLILEELAEQGMAINEMDESSRAEMKEIAQPAAIESISKDLDKNTIDSFMADVENVLAQISDY